MGVHLSSTFAPDHLPSEDLLSPEDWLSPEEPGGSSVHVVLTGEMDVYTKDRVKASLGELLDTGRIRLMTIDLAAVSKMDSAGLEALMFAVRRLREADGRLRVKPGQWRRLFTLTRLDRMMDLV
jgi:anti-sigma B factor antagonist